MDSEKLGRIDDPIDASYSAWPEASENAFGDTFLSAISPFFELAHLGQVFKERFSTKARIDRINYLLHGFRLSIQELDDRTKNSADEREVIKAKLNSPEFSEAVFLAMQESARTLNERKLKRYASILGNCLEPGEQVDSTIDLATFVRDVSQLGDEDIRVLGILGEVFGSVIKAVPNLNDPNAFTEKMGSLRPAIVDSKIHADDFRAMCERLRGFGLVVEMERNNSRMSLDDFCYRPTRRGVKLLNLLRT
jgi:hypothetical protein